MSRSTRYAWAAPTPNLPRRPAPNIPSARQSQRSLNRALHLHLYCNGLYLPCFSVWSCTLSEDNIKAGQQSQSIQTLLEAEKEAAKVVQQARQCPFRYYSYAPYIVLIMFPQIASRG